MHITRVPAIQTHAVPSKAYAPQPFRPYSDLYGAIQGSDILGPLDPAVTASNRVEIDDRDPDRHNPLATAQNNYRAPRTLWCGNCGTPVLETETADHQCPED